jgi:hypothetical protein
MHLQQLVVVAELCTSVSFTVQLVVLTAAARELSNLAFGTLMIDGGGGSRD